MPLSALKSRMNKLLLVSKPCIDDIRLLLIDTRMAIEHLAVSNQYPTVGMYGNWCCHPELSRSSHYHDIVVDVQKAYEHCKAREREELARLGLEPSMCEAKKAFISPEPMNEFFRNVISCFRHFELREELLHFYEKHNIDSTIIRIDSNWKQFLFLLMHSIVNRPLAIPALKGNRPHPTLNAMKQKAQREPLTPKKFYVEEKRAEGETGIVELWWVIEMVGPFKVTGLLMKGVYPN